MTLKLILVLLAVSLLPMLGTAYYNLRGSLAMVATQEQGNLRLLAISLANRIDQLLTDTQNIVSILAADDEVIGFLSHEGEERARYRDSVGTTVHTISRAASGIVHAYLMDRDGVFLVATNPLVQGKNYSHREYFQRARAGESFISNLIFGTTSGEPGVYFSKPVRTPAGEIVGVAVVKLKAEAVLAMLDEFRDPQEGVPTLLDENGVILHHPDPRMRFHALRPIAPERAEVILKNQGYPVERLESLDLEGLADTLARNPKAGYGRFESPRGLGPQVLGYAAMTREPWIVGVNRSEAQFARPLNDLFNQAILSMAGVGLATLLLAVVLGRALGRPVSALTQAAGIMQQAGYRDQPQGFSPGLLGLGGVTQRKDELGNLARVFEEMASQVYRREEQLEAAVRARTLELADKNQQLEAAQRRILEELRVAQLLQLSILPNRFPEVVEYDLYARTLPAREVGGDFYDYFLLGEDRIGLVVADVSGKGVPAAFFMAVCRTLFQNLNQHHDTPGQLLAVANDAICGGNNPLELFITVFYGILDYRAGRFLYANGGHNPPLLRRADGTLEFLETTDGTALGLFEGLSFAQRAIQLEPGDSLVLYTDGITEAFNRDGEEYGEARLTAALREAPANASARQLTDRLVADVHRFAAGAEVSDDLTCLVARFLGRPAMPATLNLELRNALSEIPRLAETLAPFAQAQGIAEEDLFQLNLCLDELLTNIISYGYADQETHLIHLTLGVTDGRLDLVLEDDGVPFNPLEREAAPDLEADLDERAIGGLGLFLVRTFMDELRYARVGDRNRLELSKRISQLRED